MKTSPLATRDDGADRVLRLIADRDLAGLRAGLASLTGGQRRVAAKAVDGWSRSLRTERDQVLERARAGEQDFREWTGTTWTVACVAVTGTFSAPAAAATAVLRVARVTFVDGLPAGLMIDVARERGLTWLPDLAGRLAPRLGEDHRVWAGLDEILRAYGAPAPEADAFAVGWLGALREVPWPGSHSELAAQQADWLQGSPYLPDLLPRVFEADGAWRELEYGHIWRGLIELSRREPGYRAQLLDGCLRRILLGGTAPALRPFAALWSELAPDDSEVAARVPAYTAVAASAPPGLAEQALKALHALGENGGLGVDDLLDLSAVVLARPQKALVSAQLQELDRAAGRQPGRLADILAAVEPAAQHGTPAIRGAAARILRKHAAGVTAGLGEELTAIADATDAGVRAEAAEDRDAIAVAFGSAAGQAAPLPVLPRPLEVRPLPQEPVDTAGLLEERLRNLDALRWGGRGAPWEIGVEAVLDGLARLRVTGADLDRVVPRIATHLSGRDGQALLGLAEDLAAGRCGDPALLVQCGIARVRIAELAGRLAASPVPRLVAVPTDTSGAIDPPVLLGRLAGAEAEGWEPWPLDLDQALLRTARSVPPELARRAGTLASVAGRRLARWWSPVPEDAAAWDGPIGVLLSRSSDPAAVAVPEDWPAAPVPHWLAALPHHHEAIARWLSPLTGAEDNWKWSARWFMPEDAEARLLLDADALGPGLHAVLAHCLGPLDDVRTETAAAILAELLSRPATDAVALGADFGAAFAGGRASLGRAVPGLATVAAVQPERMWLVVCAALPAVLASRQNQGFRLVQIASDLAAHLGRSGDVPGLAQAARSRSKLGAAARELASVLAGARQGP